jgi:hypothetical protein
MGVDPSPVLIGRIYSKKATWYELEVVAAAYAWQHAFKLPPEIMMSVALGVLASLCAFIVWPAPHRFGIFASWSLLSVLGAGLHSILLVYRSTKHALHAVIATACIATLLRPSFESNSTYFFAIVIPMYLGFVCGSLITAYQLNGHKIVWNVKRRKKRNLL